MPVQIDLRSAVVSPSHNVFVARPGRESRLYDSFVEHSVIGPELPGIELVPGVSIDEQPHLQDMLKRSIAVRDWAKRGKPDHNVPVRAIEEYARQPNVRGGSQFLGILRGYFETAQQGDLALIPPSAFGKNAIIAEFVDPPSEAHYVTVPQYGNFPLPVRRFRVLARAQKRALPAHVLDILAKPSAFVVLEKSIRPFIYGLAYGSYIEGDAISSRFYVTSDEYSSRDELMFLAFVNFISANTKRVTFEGRADTIGIGPSVLEDLGDFAPSLATNVNSPGFLSLGSPNITPLVVAAMFALALQVGADAVAAAEAGEVVISNSKAPKDDQCSAAVQESVLTQLKLYGLDKWPEACEVAQRAAKQSGLKPVPTVKK